MLIAYFCLKSKYNSNYYSSKQADSADSFAYNFHRVLECLDRLRQAIDDLILTVESFLHFMLKALTKTHELSHSLALKLLNVFVLLLQLTVRGVFECTKLKRFVGTLVVNLLLQVVLAIVNFLHDILFSLDSRLYFPIKLILKT